MTTLLSTAIFVYTSSFVLEELSYKQLKREVNNERSTRNTCPIFNEKHGIEALFYVEERFYLKSAQLGWNMGRELFHLSPMRRFRVGIPGYHVVPWQVVIWNDNAETVSSKRVWIVIFIHCCQIHHCRNHKFDIRWSGRLLQGNRLVLPLHDEVQLWTTQCRSKPFDWRCVQPGAGDHSFSSNCAMFANQST